MTTLALAVDADDELWTLDNLPTPEAPYVEVESELIEVRSRFPSSYYTLTGETLPPRIRVRRGIAGTTKASHIQGSTLTPNYGLGGGAGAGGVTVDNQSDPPAEVTTIIAVGADVSTPGEATIGTVLPITNEKTGAEDAEIQVLASAEDGDAALDLEVVSENGAGLVEITASGGDKAARVEVAASDALGSHFMVSFAEKIGFNGDPPVTRPVIPLTTPDVQDVIDALVALGLVTQSD